MQPIPLRDAVAVFLLVPCARADAVVVTSTNDSGAGSLRAS